MDYCVGDSNNVFVPRFCYSVSVDTALVESRTVNEDIHLEPFSVVMAKVIFCYFSVGSIGKIETLLLASEMPVFISRSRTVVYRGLLFPRDKGEPSPHSFSTLIPLLHMLLYVSACICNPSLYSTILGGELKL